MWTNGTLRLRVYGAGCKVVGYGLGLVLSCVQGGVGGSWVVGAWWRELGAELRRLGRGLRGQCAGFRIRSLYLRVQGVWLRGSGFRVQ